MNSFIFIGCVALLTATVLVHETVSFPIKLSSFCSDPNYCGINCLCNDITRVCGCSTNSSATSFADLSKRFGCTQDGQCAPQCECDVTSQQCYCPPTVSSPLRMPTDVFDIEIDGCSTDNDCAPQCYCDPTSQLCTCPSDQMNNNDNGSAHNNFDCNCAPGCPCNSDRECECGIVIYNEYGCSCPPGCPCNSDGECECVIAIEENLGCSCQPTCFCNADGECEC